jgi:hypothetical protein
VVSSGVQEPHRASAWIREETRARRGFTRQEANTYGLEQILASSRILHHMEADKSPLTERKAAFHSSTPDFLTAEKAQFDGPLDHRDMSLNSRTKVIFGRCLRGYRAFAVA